MMFFFDSSALTKRYVEEPGSDDVRDLCADADEVGVSIICLPEILSAAYRLKREGRLGTLDAARLRRELEADLAEATVMGLDESVVERAGDLLATNTLKALDALHVATALEARARLFISSDEQQLKAAKKSGLKIRKVG
jgi:uncharacterized protein